jgi:trimeric autotransporter adhesin
VTKLKRHLSVANVLSITAVFIALSATAVAATKLNAGQVKAVNIAKQAVTNAKIKTQAVTSGKIKDGGVNGKDIGAGQVTTEKLATGAVTSKKLGKKAVSPRTIANEAVTTDKIGKESIVAAKISASFYEQLVRNVAYESKTSVSTSEPNKSVTANCASGKEAIGGGVRLEGELANVSVIGSYPVSSGNTRTGWDAIAHETGGDIPGNWSVTAFVVCAEI